MFGRITSAWDAVLFGYMPRFLRKAGGFLRRHVGRILYYGCMIAILAVVAVAAERYRRQPDAEVVDMQSMPVPSAQETAPDVQTIALEALLPEGVVLLRPYSREMMWNGQLGRWESHMAADYAVDAVCSLTDGAIIACGRDGRHGGYVRVQAGEYELLYASICPDGGIKAGMHIQAGDLLGYADTSMPGEAYMGAHLHLAVQASEYLLDPQTFALEIELVD